MLKNEFGEERTRTREREASKSKSSSLFPFLFSYSRRVVCFALGLRASVFFFAQALFLLLAMQLNAQARGLCSRLSPAASHMAPATSPVRRIAERRHAAVAADASSSLDRQRRRRQQLPPPCSTSRVRPLRLLAPPPRVNPFDLAWGTSLPSDIDPQQLAANLFAFSIVPYAGFLFHLHRSRATPKLTLFGFYFLLVFVFATIPAGIYAKVHYGKILADVDWLHGGAESLLTLTNLFVVIGLRQALREEAKKEEKETEATSEASAAAAAAPAAEASSSSASASGDK